MAGTVLRSTSLIAVASLAALGQTPGSTPRAGPGLDKTPPIRLTRVESPYRATLQLFGTRGIMSLAVTAEGEAPPVSMAKRLEILKPLVEQAFREHGRLQEYTVTVGGYSELRTRLAVAAASSGKWKMTSGKPRTGHAGAFVKELLASKKLYPELDSFFDSFGYGVSVSSVEEVMLCRWDEIKPEVAEPFGPDMRPEFLLPCGASVVFRILKR